MKEKIDISGKCLCGAVSFKAKTVPHVGACHCTMCRKWGSGPFMDVDCGNDVTFTGEEHIKTFSSSDWAERGFCSKCGSNLFYRLKHNGQTLMAAGLLDDDAGLSMGMQVFVDERPPYYSFSQKTKELTGAEVIELFAGGDSGDS